MKNKPSQVAPKNSIVPHWRVRAIQLGKMGTLDSTIVEGEVVERYNFLITEWEPLVRMVFSPLSSGLFSSFHRKFQKKPK
jgi:hypothetical protein